MNCSDARPLLDVLCDGALEAKDSALVLEHLKSCAECQREWSELEQLHASFHEAKAETNLPTGLMNRISEKLKDEERAQQKRVLKQFAHPMPMVAMAATCALIGFLFLPWIPQIHVAPIVMQTASAEALIEDVAAAGTLEPVERNVLAKKVGYEMKYVRLPEWHIEKAGVYNSHAPMPIARFDFVRKSQSGFDHLSCYQAPIGVIRANAANFEKLDDKRVLFGTHGQFQFALWTQNGRDYLFVTPLSKPQLEEIVRGA